MPAADLVRDEISEVNPDCIRFEQIPHVSRLFLDFLARPAGSPMRPADASVGVESLDRFFAPNSIAAIAEQARALDFDRQRRQAIAEVLERQNREWGATDATLASISRLRAGAVVVVSGQQVGLFGGPLYSILKAASAVQLAAELSSKGVDAVPLFWLATEDHDLAEVNQVPLPAADGRLEIVTAAVKASANVPVGEVRFGAEIEPLVERAARFLNPELSAMLHSSYRAGETFGSAFGRLFSQLFAGTGLILMQPLDWDVHSLAKPLLRSAVQRAEELDRELLRRGKQLQAAGYHEQVRVTGSSTLLFILQNGERSVMQIAGDDFLVRAQRLPRAEVLERLEQHPEQFSPNVLLRPVVQDYLLPTVVYFGGPSEIAYFAQAAVVYQNLLGRVTPVLPRLSLTVVNSRLQRLLRRYGLQLPELFRGESYLRERLASRVLPAAVQQQFEQGTQAIDQLIAQFTEPLGKLDPTLVDAAGKAGRKMHHQVERLAGKAARAELRKNEQLSREAAELMNGLFPANTLQERIIPGIFLLSAHGMGLLEKLVETAGGHCHGHQMLYL
jgi:bacillithiol biosynthesis cysteine-adding enzyme BshC